MTDQPDLCCEHGAQILERLDRITDLLDARKAQREPADGVYTVTIPPASRAQAYWEARMVEEQRKADERDGTATTSITPGLAEKLQQAADTARRHL